MTTTEFNPNDPLIGQDGYEYACFADYLEDKKVDCWRNTRIEEHRRSGGSEAQLQVWIKAFDGDDKKPSHTCQPGGEIAARHSRANFALDRLGRNMLACSEPV